VAILLHLGKFWYILSAIDAQGSLVRADRYCAPLMSRRALAPVSNDQRSAEVDMKANSCRFIYHN
jgi:hypothetical protein